MILNLVILSELLSLQLSMESILNEYIRDHLVAIL